MAVRLTLQIVPALAFGLVALGCGSSPTAPSASPGVAESALFAFGDGSSTNGTLAARPGRQFCEYPDLQVSASVEGGVLDGGPALLVGSFSGVHRYGTMAGSVAVDVSTQHVLRNRHLEIMHQHTLTLADGAFIAAGRSLLRPLSNRSGGYRLRARLPVTGGTKIFLDAQGELHLDGIFDRTSGTMQYRLTGEICRTGLVPVE
jgi:hypothetical protein